MEFRLLGEIELRAGGRSLDVGTPRQQVVLAVLAIEAAHPVPIETLVDRVWPDPPPTEARNVLYSHLSRIRALLRQAAELSGTPASVVRRNAGYVLDVDPTTVDLHRFARLTDHGKDPHGPAAGRAAALAEALALWRGTPLAGITGDWATQVRDSAHRRRLDTAVRWGELELELGHAAAVIGTIGDLIAEYPLAEPLEGLLMRGLHAAGRDAEAIHRYVLVRERLADELGTDPGPELRALHAALLRGELLARRAEPEPAQAHSTLTPAQLPPDIPGFTGRDEELRLLDEFATGAARVVAVSGTAGVGKTALAVHWAHRTRAEFPGGQLYVNLRGFDPTGTPVTPPEAVRVLLDAFDVPRQRIPASFAAQVGLYRSVLADRKVLVVLDNAHDAEQVRQLLPGSPSCLTLVTSRTVLAGLITSGAHPLTVRLLDTGAARELLAGRIGPARVATERAAVESIVASCARLPLALAVAAARAVTHPRFPLAALADQLRDARGSLDEFSSTDPATDPRAVFSWSYQRLSAAAAALFRLIGLHPGPELSTAAAASLAGLPAAGVRQLLAELTGAHLLDEASPGRFTAHDLLRAYAREEAELIELAADRDAATHRLLAHYIHSADHADRILDPHRQEPPALTELPPSVAPERPEDRAAALRWFEAERPVLRSAIHQEQRFDVQVWELVWATQRFLAHNGHWHEELDTLTVALAAARRLDDPIRQAFAHCHLGCTSVWFEEFDEANAQLETAAGLYRKAGDRVGEAFVHYYLSWMLETQKNNSDALAHAEQALALFTASDHEIGQARCLNAVGWFHALAGEAHTAIDHCQRALDLQLRLGDRLRAGQTWHSLGYAHDRLGHYQEAVDCHQASVELFRDSGYRFSEAYALSSLGDAHRNAGDVDAARAAWRMSFDIFDQLGHPDASRVRAKMADIPVSPEI